MHPAFSVVLLALLVGCPGDEITTETLVSGSYALDHDTAVVTLTVDVAAGTFTLAEDGGATVSGTLTLASEEDWAECCYLNGSGHTEFETFRLDPATIAVGPVDVTDAALTAVPSILEFESAADAYTGFQFD